MIMPGHLKVISGDSAIMSEDTKTSSQFYSLQKVQYGLGIMPQEVNLQQKQEGDKGLY